MTNTPCRQYCWVKRLESNVRAVPVHQALTGSIGDWKLRNPANKIPSKKTGARAPAYSIKKVAVLGDGNRAPVCRHAAPDYGRMRMAES